MSKKTLYLLGILLTIMIGMYFHSNYCCDGTYEEADVNERAVEQVTSETP